MANPLPITVKESLSELKALLKNQPSHFKPRVQMLITIKKSTLGLSKNALAELIGVNHNSIQTWRKKYLSGGIDELLSHGKTGFKPSVITPEAHQAIETKLNEPLDGFSSFKELQQWVDANFVKGIKYVTINSYVKRYFGAKLKVARKSHLHKDQEKTEAFKKTSVGSLRKP